MSEPAYVALSERVGTTMQYRILAAQGDGFYTAMPIPPIGDRMVARHVVEGLVLRAAAIEKQEAEREARNASLAGLSGNGDTQT